MRRSRWLPAGLLALGMLACGQSSSAANLEVCQDMRNLQGTIDALAAPPRDATVGEVRADLDKLDGTFDAIHDNADVPDAEDDALLQAQEDYRDVIEGIGDDDGFAPYVAPSQGIAEGLARSFQAARVRLACPAGLQPG